MGVIHEVVLGNNKQSYYLGKVREVSRKEGEEVTDALGDVLYNKEIIFDVGELITRAKAAPLNVTSEVNVGDEVIIFSFESLYNNTFYYYPIRNITEDNQTIHMSYGNSDIEFNPVDNTNTDLILASGKALVILESSNQKVNIKSGYGGIQLNSDSGLIDIKNKNYNLSSLMDKLIDTIANLKVMTQNGPAPVMPIDVVKLNSLATEFSMLLGDVDNSEYDPHLPNDTYTLEFAAKVVEETGIHFLNDEQGIETSDKVNNLQSQLPNDTEPTNISPQISDVVPGEVEEDISPCGLGSNLSPSTKLSDNFTLSRLTTKALFPHKLKSQHNLSKQDIACNLRNVAINILEPIMFQYPNMRINSGFRGSPSMKNRVSQHEKGQAVDLQFPGMTPQDYLAATEWIIENVAFDQLIFEHGNSIWLHISFNAGNNRKKLLTMKGGNYESGIKLYY